MITDAIRKATGPIRIAKNDAGLYPWLIRRPVRECVTWALLPVSPGCFKHFKTTGDMNRFNTVQHGSSRISKVVHGAATVVTRFITVYPGSSNRGEPAP